MLPQGEAGHDEVVEFGEDGGEGLGLVRWRGGQAGGDVAGLVRALDGAAGQAGVVVGKPVDELVAVGAELFGGHGASSWLPVGGASTSHGNSCWKRCGLQA
jgi:hypothetical protein